ALGKCALTWETSGSATPSGGGDAAATSPPQKASNVASKTENSSGRVASTVRSARWTSARSPRSITSSARIASWLSDGVIARPGGGRRRQNRTVPVRRSRGRGAAAGVIVVGRRGPVGLSPARALTPAPGSALEQLGEPAGREIGLDALDVVDLLQHASQRL